MSIAFEPISTKEADVKITVQPNLIQVDDINISDHLVNHLLHQSAICERFIADRSASIYFTQMMITYIYITSGTTCTVFETAVIPILIGAIINVCVEVFYSLGMKVKLHVWRSMLLQIILILIINTILLAISIKYAMLIVAKDSDTSCNVLHDRIYWFVFGIYMTSSLFQILRIQFRLRKLSLTSI